MRISKLASAMLAADGVSVNADLDKLSKDDKRLVRWYFWRQKWKCDAIAPSKVQDRLRLSQSCSIATADLT